MVQCQGVELKQRVLISGFIAIVCSGCATSGDMSYQYSRHGAQCVELGREIAKQQGDSEYRRSINRQYYQNCVGN